MKINRSYIYLDKCYKDNDSKMMHCDTMEMTFKTFVINKMYSII